MKRVSGNPIHFYEQSGWIEALRDSSLEFIKINWNKHFDAPVGFLPDSAQPLLCKESQVAKGGGHDRYLTCGLIDS